MFIFLNQVLTSLLRVKRAVCTLSSATRKAPSVRGCSSSIAELTDWKSLLSNKLSNWSTPPLKGGETEGHRRMRSSSTVEQDTLVVVVDTKHNTTWHTDNRVIKTGIIIINYYDYHYYCHCCCYYIICVLISAIIYTYILYYIFFTYIEKTCT